MPSGSPTSGVGRVVAGRYLLLNRLGSGGMGHVWLALDQRLACEVALKEIVFSSPAEADAEREARVARARAEARHAAGLRGHPHVVTVHDVLEHEGLPWIVMEYVPGALDLRELVARHGPLPPAECARVGLAVLDALTAGHERGVMHRDVKPANILLAADRAGAPYARVLLTDYGISVRPDADETRYTLTSVLVGTAGYLAPERATGGAPTPAADLFSLGCTLYYAVEGQGPFERGSHLAEITAVVMEEPRPPVRAGALEPVLRAMLEKDPARRTTAADAEAALSRIVVPESASEHYRRTRTDVGSEPPWEAGPGQNRLLPTSGSTLGRNTFDAPSTPVTGRNGFEAASTPAPNAHGFTAPSAPAPNAHGFAAPSAPPPSPHSLKAPSTPTSRPHGSGTPSAPDPGPSPAPAPAATPGRRHRTRRRFLRPVLSLALGLVLALGGVWYAMANRTTGATAQPYGKAVGLSAPLKDGDCVLADWPDGRFQGTPRLSVDPSCRDKAPDGQVMGFVPAASAAEAARLGPARCEQRTQEVRERLADVRGLAVVPTVAGFEAAGRRTVCLVLGAHGPVYGPLGDHRKTGSAFPDTATMQKRDCLDVHSNREARLVPCTGRHDQEVLGFTRLARGVTLAGARTASDAACSQDVPPGDYGFDPSVYEAASWTSEGPWKSGTHLVVCAVRKQNGGTMEGDGP
ncbi:protein kinase [Streptomyces sp. NPDC046197]|uniref:serine/threonine-protein kinase n=1 Tax=Streptomyces sp. NPDC046197 TaxID=3154337 RepID=UPI0033C50473